MKTPLIVVRREFFDAFARGEKDTEYRRYGGQFNERVFAPGRAIRIAYNYNLARFGYLTGIVRDFTVADAADHPVVARIWPDLKPDDKLALIRIELTGRSTPAPDPDLPLLDRHN